MKTYRTSAHKQKFSKLNKNNKVKSISLIAKLKIFFGNANFVFGFAFFVLGLAVTIGFSLTIDLSDLKFLTQTPTTQGEIISAENTNSSVNEKVVVKYSYSYTVNGKEYSGTSYTTKSLDETVEVCYLKDNPEISKIKGTRKGEMPFWVILFTLIFPITGFLIMFFAVRKILNWINIIENGKIALGVFSRSEATGTFINEQQVMRFFFKFNIDGKEYEAVGETRHTYRLTDEQYEPVIYNFQNPNEAIMVDGLPYKIRKLFAHDIEYEKIRSESV